MQTQPNFQQILDRFVADLEADQAKVKAKSNDPDWHLYYANTEAEAAAAPDTAARGCARGIRACDGERAAGAPANQGPCG